MAILNNLREIRSWMDSAQPHVVPQWQIDLVQKKGSSADVATDLLPSIRGPFKSNSTNSIPGSARPDSPLSNGVDRSFTRVNSPSITDLLASQQTRLGPPRNDTSKRPPQRQPPDFSGTSTQSNFLGSDTRARDGNSKPGDSRHRVQNSALSNSATFNSATFNSATFNSATMNSALIGSTLYESASSNQAASNKLRSNPALPNQKNAGSGPISLPTVPATSHDSDDSPFDDDDFIDLSILKQIPPKRPAVTEAASTQSKRPRISTSTQDTIQPDSSIPSLRPAPKPSAGPIPVSAPRSADPGRGTGFSVIGQTSTVGSASVGQTSAVGLASVVGQTSVVRQTPSKDTDVRALQAYILACEDKINLLAKCNAVNDSTSLSLDAKKLWHTEKFVPKMKGIDEKVAGLRSGFTFLRPVPTDLSNIHSDTSFGKLPSLSIISSPIKAASSPAHELRSIEPAYGASEPILSHAPEPILLENSVLSPEQNYASNLDEARHLVLDRRNRSASPVRGYKDFEDVEDVEDDDPEDEMGENFMDGLQSSQVDELDTDLSGFIAHDDEEGNDAEFADRTYTATQATQVGKQVLETDEDEDYEEDDDYENNVASVHEDYSIRNEIADLRLSQDVAERYNMNYEDDPKLVEISDDESENDDGNFTTQLLNEGRDQVVEIFSDEELNDDVFDALEARPQVKLEAASVKSHTIDDSDFSDDDDEILKVAAAEGVDDADREVLAGSEAFIEEVYSVLKDTFQLPKFRPNQLKAVVSTLQGKDVFVLIPTGGGKSLCYQLPALVTRGKTRGTTVVISPLISLMQDQIHHLQKRNIRADMISSRGSAKEKSDALRSFAAGNLDLVYLSPEMVNKAQSIQRILGRLHDNNMLARIVVDEAHCVSSWGHDFRPDYQGMSMFKENYPDVPVMALTATANEKVRLDIINNLHMNDPVLLKQSFNRTNLFYKVMKKPGNVYEWLRDYISVQQFRKTGIIYCHSKQSCETTSEKLESYGIKCKYYHAGMDADDRFEVQTQWQENKIQVICATIAFGMGIDKPDVRYVIHIYIPRTLEGYYQETGRAGRDGNPSECIMFYAYKDARALKGLIEKDKDLDWSSREMHLAKLRQVTQYCENGTDCRRRQVLHYFNEVFDAKLCNKNCDNCCSDIVSVQRDVTEHCANIVKLVQSIHKDKVTVIHCQDVYWGSKNQKIMTLGHQNNPHHGAGRELNKGDMERIFFYLQCENALMEYQVVKGGYATSYVKLGPKANAFIKATKKIELSFAVVERPTSSGAAKLTASGNGTGIVGFRYQESFRSAREIRNQEDAEKENEYGRARRPPSRIVLPLETFDGAVTDSNKELIDKAYFELRNSRTLKVSELGYARAEAFIGDNLLKEMAIKLPTNARDFARLRNVTNEQADHFKHFKHVLNGLARDRKKAVAELEGPSQVSAVTLTGDNRIHSSPYFQNSQAKSSKAAGTQKSKPRAKSNSKKPATQRKGATHKSQSKASSNKGLSSHIRRMPI